MKMIKGLDIKPFTRLIWWSGAGKRFWGDKIATVHSLYHELEYESVKRKKRKVCTRHFQPAQLPRAILDLEQDGMRFLPIRKTGNYSGFSHRHLEPKPGSWSYYGVISQDFDSCLAFKEATDESDHTKMGELLGYSPEAGDFFQKYFVEERLVDPIWPIKGGEKIEKRKKIVRTDPFNNIAMRYFGMRWIPFFPPTWDFEYGLEFGSMMRELAYDLDEKRAEWMDILLKMPYTWNCYKGVVEVVTPIFKGITNSMPTAEKWTITFLPENYEFPKHSMVPRSLEKYA